MCYSRVASFCFFFFFQAEDGIRDVAVTGVQTCALPISDRVLVVFTDGEAHDTLPGVVAQAEHLRAVGVHLILVAEGGRTATRIPVRDQHWALQVWQRDEEIGRAHV